MKSIAVSVSLGLTLLSGPRLFAAATSPPSATLAPALGDPHPPAVPANDLAGSDDDRDPLRDLGAASGLSLDAYADSLDYDVSYDDAVAAHYDDGYDPDAYKQFQDALAPYGTWIDDPAYGRIWIPSVAQVGDDFTPYATNGDWLDTEYGWTWSSGWSWGWAPFHYGRWVGCERGWAWVPGTLWGPAWVSWRAGGGYVGWAPLPPRGVSLASPIGVHSPWRFMVAGQLGRGRGPYLAPRFVPSAFMRTSVISNTRLLPDGASTVRVNAGPVIEGRGSGRAVHLASAAPRALPRYAIHPHPGAPAAVRPWVLSGRTGQLPYEESARVHSFAEPPRGTGTVGAAGGYARGGDWSAGGHWRGGPHGSHAVGQQGGQARESEPEVFFPVYSYSAGSSSGGRHGSGRSSSSAFAPSSIPSSVPASIPSPGYSAPLGGFTAPVGGFTASPLLFTGASSGTGSYGRPAAASPPFHGPASHGAGGRHR